MAVPDGIHPRLLTEVAEAISVALATVCENPWRLRGRDRHNTVYLFKLQKEKSEGIRDKGALLVAARY